MAFKRMKPVRPAASAPLESQAKAAWLHAEKLIEDGDLSEAKEHLEAWHRRYPTRKEPLLLLLEFAAITEDSHYGESVLERLVTVAPQDADYALLLAQASLSNEYIALARERFLAFLERWPDHEEAAEVRKTVAALEHALVEMMDIAGLRQPDRFELAARNDAIQGLFAQGRYADARRIAQQMLDRDIFYAPALNNLVLGYLQEGKPAEAVSYAHRILEREPDNVHALANLVHALVVLGRDQEAVDAARRLKASKAYATDRTGKIMEALSFLGDDDSVLDVYEHARKSDSDSSLERPVPHHLAGAAAMRLGQSEMGQRCWDTALTLDPEFSLTLANLADLKLPIGERSGAWAFSMQYWLPKDLLPNLIAAATPSGTHVEDRIAKSIGDALERYPFLETVVPILLERGDPHGRQFAFLLAKATRTPAMLQAIRDFALSPHGPDSMRMEAANVATQAGVLDGGTVRLWAHGEQQEVLLMDWEVYTEGTGGYSPQVDKLVGNGIRAIQSGDGKRAERLFQQAFELAPDEPSILNNLANTYKYLGRIDEARELMQDIYEQFPDYFFGAINMANLLRESGDIEGAHQLVLPLMSQKRLHVTEFDALAQAQIELQLAKGDTESARQWYDMWKPISPEHPAMHKYRRQFEPENIARLPTLPGRLKPI